MYKDCYSIEDVVGRIFENGLKVNYEFTEKDAGTKYGYYLRNKSIPNKEVRKLPQLERLFINARKKCKYMKGENNEADIENLQAEVFSYICQCLLEVFRGEHNQKFIEKGKTSLVCDGTLEDCIRLLEDERRVVELCSYTIRYVDNKMRKLSQEPSNPDKSYNRYNDSYTDIHYLYLDEEVDGQPSKYELLEKEEPKQEKDYDNVAEYILDNYFDRLTPKQQLWCKCHLEFGERRDGCIYDLDNNLLYTREDGKQYIRYIKKTLTKCIEEDNNLIIVNDRIQFSRWRE